MPSTTEHLHALATAGVHNGVYPGAVWAVGNADGVIDRGATGLLDPTRSDEPMKPDTVFDIASLTKILAVWTTIGTLWQDRHLDLDEPLGQLWPGVAGYPLGQVTAHQLLTHTAGLPLRAQLKSLYGTDPDAIRSGVLHEALHRPPGQAVEYTDRAALILGYLAEYLSGEQLDHLATDRVWRPARHARDPIWTPADERGRALRPHRARRRDRRAPQGRRSRLLRPPSRRRIRHRRSVLHPRRPHRAAALPAGPCHRRDAPGLRSRVDRASPSTSTPAASNRHGACSGTRLPAPTPPTRPGPTTASPAPPSGSTRNRTTGRSCSPTSSTTPATANPSLASATSSAASSSADSASRTSSARLAPGADPATVIPEGAGGRHAEATGGGPTSAAHPRPRPSPDQSHHNPHITPNPHIPPPIPHPLPHPPKSPPNSSPQIPPSNSITPLAD